MASPFVIGSTTYVTKMSAQDMCGSYLLLRTIKVSLNLTGTLIKQCQVGKLVVVAAAVETVRADTFLRKPDRFDQCF